MQRFSEILALLTRALIYLTALAVVGIFWLMVWNLIQ